MLVAVTREVSPSIGQCELTHLAREAIDVEKARLQHRQYEDCLAALGCEVHRLPAEPDLPDSVFVEDTAIVFDELAIITHPGAGSRRPETEAVAEALGSYRELSRIEPPGTIDGGDVMRVGKTVFVGLSRRSNPLGVERMRTVLRPFGYTVKGIPLNDCLHLKSAVTQVAERTLLINRAWVDAGELADACGGVDFIDIDPGEPFGGNALLIGETVVYASAHPGTRKKMEERGIPVVPVDVSELAKAEGGVTCCSLVFDA
jgi:dimethylargininase